MPALETPMGLALVVCDTIIEDKLTGKKTLVGLFDRLQTSRLPCVHPAMTVFVSLTGGRGEYPPVRSSVGTPTVRRSLSRQKGKWP